MPLKRFRTRRLRSNLILWSIASMGLFVFAVVLVAVTGGYWASSLVVALICAGMAVAWSRDRGDETVYLLDEQRLVLRRKQNEEEFQLADVLDANLVDRVAARDYFSQRVRSLQGTGSMAGKPKEARRAFMRFCTVDIGLNTLSFGIGRRMIDRMPRAKDDLVLLRARNGRERLLSPVYNQDLVDNIGRLLQARPRPAVHHRQAG
ncbi:MAG TPA: hypothetical protein VHL57_00760 [Flavobacteriales bacterium]|jgi:hypothetical protein|nr:hypothetical protein [Flavobacteriales bacterium]